jgi:hypothetical protein
MKFVDEVLESYFSQLEPKAQAYARKYYRYLSGYGRQPQPRAFGIGDADAQTVRIRLAGLV